MPNPFTEHPQAVGETYFQHFCKAMQFSISAATASLGALVHAIAPFLCVKTASNRICALAQVLDERRKCCDEYDAKKKVSGEN